MIRKYRFGNPLNTEAVVEEHPIEQGKLPRVEVKEGEKISFMMTKDAPVYGLGEQVRGINKRGWIYISNCTDDPNHREDTRSLYAAHNFLLFAVYHKPCVTERRAALKEIKAYPKNCTA